jgi:hypothetical protein
MMGCAAVFMMVGMFTGSEPAFAFGLVLTLIHLDRLNRPEYRGGDEV